jgi:hypothetical protein
MLNTLVHEIAHHDDLMRRTGRGRWLKLNENKCEDYAEFKEAEWTKDIVVPYLLETYPDEYSRLTQWIKENGGINLHLTELVRPYDGKGHSKMFRLGTTINGAVEKLFSNAAQGKSARDDLTNM